MLLQKIIEELNLYEGLEITHEIDQTVYSLNNWCDFDGHVTFQNKNTYIKMVVLKPITKNNFDHILKITNNYGYFPSSMNLDGNHYKFDYQTFLQRTNTSGTAMVMFDPKYDPQISDVNLPNYGYHIAPSKYEEKILQIGLAPRSKEKMTKHPERIYFTTFLNDGEDLLQSNKFTNADTKFTIFKFDLKKLKKNRVIRFFSDPIYPARGFYTYENIPPQYLEVVKRIQL